MASGIYKIENIENGKVYVGSAVDLDRRFRDHINSLRRNKHKNQYLQNVYNKYGEKIFKFRVIEYVEDKERLINREQYYIDSYGFDSLYNINPIAGSCLGRRLSVKTKMKISLANRGNKPTRTSFKPGHTTNVGREVSEETRKKLSIVSIGKTHSEETKKKLSGIRKGVKHTEQHKKKISEALKGRVLSEEHKKKLVAANLGEKNPNYGSSKDIQVINGVDCFECCRCKEYLSREKFNVCSTVTHGIYPSCKECRSIYRKKRYKEKVLKAKQRKLRGE